MQCSVSTRKKRVPIQAADQELIRLLQKNHGLAFQVIYQRYARLIYSLAMRILKSTEDAEDITQEIFLSLHHQSHYDANRGSLKNFLALQARSRAIDRLRSRKTRYTTLNHLRELSTQPVTANPIDKIEKQQTTQHVRRALSLLPHNQREILENAYYRDLSQSEISHRLSLPLGTVKSRSRQGLKKLRCTLAKVER